MAFHRWQVGLDIQSQQLCAIVVQRRRTGWQLCDWWSQTLAQDALKNGVLQRSAALQKALQSLGKRLPRRYSLRVALPPQLVLQRTLPLPALSLREPALERYISAAAQHLFPVGAEALALDYRYHQHARQLSVTAARQAVISQWQTPLLESGMQPAVFELTSYALAQVAFSAGLGDNAALLLYRDGEWLWYCRACEPQSGAASVLASAILPADVTRFGCAPAQIRLPPGYLPFSPLSLFTFHPPPLPPSAAEFCIAAGLALREEDHP